MGFELRFTDKEVTAWGGMGLMACHIQPRFYALKNPNGEYVLNTPVNYV